jgi:hypothetical protein
MPINMAGHLLSPTRRRLEFGVIGASKVRCCARWKTIGASGREKTDTEQNHRFVIRCHRSLYVQSARLCCRRRSSSLTFPGRKAEATRPSSHRSIFAARPDQVVSANESWAGNTLPPLLDALVWPNAVPRPGAARRSVNALHAR